MTNRISKNVYNIELLENDFYSKIFILICLGYNTYDKMQKFRSQEESKKIRHCNLNIQLGNLVRAGMIKEDGYKRKYNRKLFLPKEGLLFQLFLQHLNDRYNHYVLESEKEEEQAREKIANEPLEVKRWYEQKLAENEKTFKVKPLEQEKPMPCYLFKNHSLKFQALIEDLALDYFQWLLETNRHLLLNSNLATLFDALIKEIMMSYFLNLQYTQGGYPYNGFKLTNNQKDLEIRLLWKLCVQIEGFNISPLTACVHTRIKHHLGKVKKTFEGKVNTFA